MKLPRITILATLLLTVPAAAQLQITPPAATPSPPAEKQKPRPPPVAKKKEAAPAPKPSASPKPAPAATVIPAPPTDNSNVDLVFGAYQRGQYKTALDLATARAATGDAKAMTMLGELYSNAMGIRRDYVKALQWYKRAADAGDREAMFALAMLRISGRGGAVDKGEAVKLMASRRQARRAQGGL
ncbi:TPR repeat protein [Bradyrhizobium sp. LM3.4]